MTRRSLTQRQVAEVLVVVVIGLVGVLILMSAAPLFGVSDTNWQILRGVLGLLVGVCMAAIAVAALILLPPRVYGDLDPSTSRIIGLVTVGLLLVVTMFAGLYLRLGIVGPETDVPPTFSDAFYLSVVTVTTLGYGDFRPAPSARLLAAAEALFGYVFMALIVAGIVERLLAFRQRMEGEDNAARPRSATDRRS